MTHASRAPFLAVLAASAILTVAPSASHASSADDLQKVLARLDASAAKFKSAQADIVWDHVQVKPIEDDDKQLGSITFERRNGEMQVALRLKTDNGSPVQKDMVYAGGVGKLYEARLKQLQVFQVGDKRSELETFLTLGFGGSGKDLQKNWIIDYAATEQLNGASTARLNLVPRDPALAKTTPKVILWIDLEKGVALKQQRFESDGNYVIFTYSNLRLNGSVPSNAFEIKTAPGTQTVNH
jgi:outer membrane lipoprotein-sorting protein